MTNNTHIPECYDVAIVGYGPTGATLANLLARRGRSVLVLERAESIYDLPRAVHFDDETLRVFAEVGIAEELTQKTRVNLGMQFVDLDGNLLLDWPRPQQPTSLGWNASYRFHQPDLERLLRAALEAHKNADVRCGVSVTGLEQAEGNVRINTKKGNAGEEAQFCARYAVGCDGAGSTVRRSIGHEMEDLGFREKWLVVDVQLKREIDRLGDHTIQYCNDETPMTYCRGTGNRRRWEMRAPLDADDTALTQDEYVWSLLSRWLTPEDAEIERSAVYVFGSAIAEQWRSDRLMIAGDAAHLTPPFMGQGLCAGIRDAVNLAWKLDHAVRSGDDIVLDSYQTERRPHVRAYVEMAIKLGSLINSLDREGAIAFASGDRSSKAKMQSITPPLGPGMQAGNLSNGGTVFPNPILSDGTRLDPVARGRWVLVGTGKMPESTAQVLRVSSEDQPEVAGLMEERGAGAILMRPDGYLLGVAETESEIAILEDFLKPFDLS